MMHTLIAIISIIGFGWAFQILLACLELGSGTSDITDKKVFNLLLFNPMYWIYLLIFKAIPTLIHNYRELK